MNINGTQHIYIYIYISNWWLLNASTLIMGLMDISEMLNSDSTMA